MFYMTDEEFDSLSANEHAMRLRTIAARFVNSIDVDRYLQKVALLVENKAEVGEVQVDEIAVDIRVKALQLAISSDGMLGTEGLIDSASKIEDYLLGI